jgi:uncharacterized protein YrrD
MLHRMKDLQGGSIVAQDGEIGSLEDVFFEDERWGVLYLVVSTGGWLVGRRLLISPSALDIEHSSDEALRIQLTREQAESSPGMAADRHLRSSKELIGYDLEAPDGAIGHIEDVLVDDASWAIADMVVDTRKWLPGGKRVLVAPSAVERIEWSEKKVHVRLSRDDVRNSPEAGGL